MICRPFLDNSNTLEDFDGDGCADGEARDGEDTWASLGACKSGQYTTVSCYSLTLSSPKYYTIVNNPVSCPLTSDLVIATSTGDTQAAATTAAGTYVYETDSDLRHQRCNHAGDAVVSNLHS